MDIIGKLKEELKVEKWQIEAAVALIDEGNTIPFISRYRKEATGALNDETLRDLHERLMYLRNLEDKKTQVIGSIEEQGKMTEELKEKILAAKTAGIQKVLVPADNEKDVEEISKEIKSGVEIVFVKSMKDVLDHALLKKRTKGNEESVEKSEESVEEEI